MKITSSRIFISILFCVLFALALNGQGLPLAPPQSVGMNAAKLEQIEPLVNADIADKKLPVRHHRRTQGQDRLSKSIR
jgi:hypothetical protein